jgi:hypothetical protein
LTEKGMTLPARCLVAFLLASTLATVIATRGFDQFNGVRSKVVTASMPAVGGVVDLLVANRGKAEALRPPFALIARVSNYTADTASFSIDVDGQRVCERRVPPHTGPPGERIDCAVTGAWEPGNPHGIVIRGAAATWSLESLELATHHGNTNGVHAIFVVPAGSRSFSRPSVAAIVASWLFMVGLFLLPFPDRMPRAVLMCYWFVAGLIGLAIVTIVLAPIVSPFAIVLSIGTILRWAVVLALPGVWRLGRALLPFLPGLAKDWTPAAACALVVLTVTGGYAAVMFHGLRDAGGNYSGFLQIDQAEFDGNPLLQSRRDVRETLILRPGGYDGQFMYFAAFDPFMRAFHADPVRYRSYMDSPPYRFGRIGFAWLTNLASLGTWQRYPATMIWLVLGAIGATALGITVAARQASVSPAWGLIVLLVPGFWASLGTGLPEPIAAAFLIFGYLAWTRGRWPAAGLLLAASLLVRETGAVFVVILAAATYLRGERRPALTLAVLAFLPVVLWRLYMGWVLYPDWGLEGFLYNPHDLGLPFAGFIELWGRIRNGTYLHGIERAGIWYPIVLTSFWAFALVVAAIRRTPLAWATVVYGTVAISLNYGAIWVHVGNGQRGTYELFVLAALSTVTLVGRSRAWRIGATAVWALAGAYVFWLGLDAASIRETVLSAIWLNG